MSEVAQSCPTLCDPMDGGYQAPPSMGFSRQEYRSGLPFPSPGDLPNPGIEPHCRLIFLPAEPQGKPIYKKVVLVLLHFYTFICIKYIIYIFNDLTGDSHLHPMLLAVLFCARRSCEVSKCPSDRNAGLSVIN